MAVKKAYKVKQFHIDLLLLLDMSSGILILLVYLLKLEFVFNSFEGHNLIGLYVWETIGEPGGCFSLAENFTRKTFLEKQQIKRNKEP